MGEELAARPPRLLHFRVSHYNEKVRWALDFKRWPHLRKALLPGFHVAALQLKTGQRKVPVLEIDGERLIGSSHIIAELERRRPEPALFPAGESDRSRALAIQSYFDEEVAPAVRRLFWSTYLGDAAASSRMASAGASAPARAVYRALFPLMRPLFRRNMGMDRERLVSARGNLAGFFDRLESEIGPSGYLVGDRFGVADLAAASVMSAILRPPQFSYPLPDPWPAELVALRDSVADRRGARWVMDIYQQHRGDSAEIRPG